MCVRALFATALLLPLFAAASAGHAQTTPAPPAQQTTPQTTPPAAQPPDTGGPDSDNGGIVIPKKKESDEPPPPPAPAEPKVKNPNGETFSLRVDVPIVNLDVSVILDKNHQFVPGLKPRNFLVLEDGVEQKVDTVRIAQTPITAVMLLEFAANYWLRHQRHAERRRQLLPLARARRLHRRHDLRPADPHPRRLHQQQAARRQ